ncbi:MAG: glycosyltransferase family 4 protein [Anaerolineae bacterium]|nr:glycosyltransferase family 4 protein [Anaerolineae bacterium]
MRIGLLAPDLTEAHGWGRYTLDLARMLAARGDATFVIAAATGSPREVDLPHDRYLPILPPLFPSGRWTTPRVLLAVPRLVVALRGCDVIHTTAEHYLPAAALVAWLLRRPLFVTAHGTYLPMSVQRRGVGWLFRWAARRATILPVSHYTAGRIREALPGLPESAVAVVHNGVHADRFAALPDALPEKRGPTVLGVGVNKARKGFHLLVEALATVRRTVPDARCVILGDDRDAAFQRKLRDLVEQHDLGDGVDILGRVPDDLLRGWYHVADVFALPALNVGGKFEGFGLVYLEAGAAGLPVIGTWGCGAEEAIDDGVTGLLVPQGDVAALADAITRLLTDPDLRARLGAAGREKAFASTWDHVAAQVRALYEGE